MTEDLVPPDDQPNLADLTSAIMVLFDQDTGYEAKTVRDHTTRWARAHAVIRVSGPIAILRGGPPFLRAYNMHVMKNRCLGTSPLWLAFRDYLPSMRAFDRMRPMTRFRIDTADYAKLRMFW